MAFWEMACYKIACCKVACCVKWHVVKWHVVKWHVVKWHVIKWLNLNAHARVINTEIEHEVFSTKKREPSTTNTIGKVGNVFELWHSDFELGFLLTQRYDAILQHILH